MASKAPLEFSEKLISSLSPSCQALDFTQCNNSDLLRLCADKAGDIATSKSGMGIIAVVVIAILICCCIMCCCSSSGVYYWNKNQTKQETQ